MMSKYRWAEYEFDIHSHHVTNWTDTGGVYIFAQPVPDRIEAIFDPHLQWKALYIGKTGSFKRRFDGDHEKWMDALDLGFSYVHILPVDEENERKRIEKQLIKTYIPRLNVQGK